MGEFFMRKYIRDFIAVAFISISFSQPDMYRSIDDIKSQWEEKTSFQKEEMISFCDFLFKEGYYERCLLVSFQILYKFPDDPIIPAINYHIARCYEETKNYDLAHRYYSKAITSGDKTSIIYKASVYRDHYINLILKEQNKELLAKLNHGINYAHMSWTFIECTNVFVYLLRDGRRNRII